MTEPTFSGPGTLDAIAPLRLPDPGTLFARRAERFAALAPGNTLGEYLAFLARLALAQASAVERVDIPTDARPSTPLRHARGERTSYPLDAANHSRHPAWRDVLAHVVDEVTRGDAPPETRDAMELLRALPPPELEALADRVLANAVAGSDLAAGPIAAAALQAYFTVLASRLDAAAVAPQRDACPVCASQPVVGVVLGDDKVRYLVCSLCASQWHHTRVECTVCHSGAKVSYYGLEGGRGPATAEACGACKAYTKLLYIEKDPDLEPFADDVATLSLDLLMAEDGWQRHGVNLFLLPGDAKAPLAS